VIERVDFISFGKLAVFLHTENPLRIPAWTPESAPRDAALLEAILKRRGGRFINLDRVLLWSEPLARGWNTYVGAIRRELSLDARLREIAICTVARLTGADYEFTHHWPEYVKAGGDDRLKPRIMDPDSAATDTEFSADERLAIRYATSITREVKVPEQLFRLVRERFTTTELVELTAAIATYNMVARILVPLGVEDEGK